MNLAANPIANLILVGPMGAGKTSIGRRLARALGLTFVDIDQLLEARTGASVSLIFEMEGEAGFRRRETELLAEVCAAGGQLIATGGGAVLDPENRQTLRSGGFVVFLDISVEQQLMRLSRDRTRPLLRAPDRRQRLLQMAEQRRPLYLDVADLVFDGNGLSASRASQRVLTLIAHRWQSAPDTKTSELTDDQTQTTDDTPTNQQQIDAEQDRMKAEVSNR